MTNQTLPEGAPRKKSRNKPSKTEIRRRIDITESLLIDCASVTEIARYFAEKEGLTLARRTVERYRELAEKRIEHVAEPVRERELHKAKLRLERCYARAITGNKKNVPAAIAAQKAINALLGLNALQDTSGEMTPAQFAELVVQQQKEMHRITLGTDGLRSEMEELIEQYREMGEEPMELLRELTETYHSKEEAQNG